MTAPEALPKSVTSGPVNFLGFGGAVLCILLLTGMNISPGTAAVICILAAGTPIMVVEILFLKIHRRETTGLDFTRNIGQAYNYSRVFTKYAGLLITLALIAFAYWLFPEYHGSFYGRFQKTVLVFLPLFLLLAVPYFLFVDYYMRDPYDGYWHVGRLFLGKWHDPDMAKIREHFMGWIIKAFFLPLMFTFLSKNMGWLISHSPSIQFQAYLGGYHWWLNFVFTIDLIFASVGYLMTLRLTDSHIRSSHPFFFGWFITLLCYAPFWSFMSDKYFRYDDSLYWLGWLREYPMLANIWGLAILGTLTIYSWATITFGLRFSNLTHRGILTNGPYRFTKHPAYVFKNISWWLISVPFISSGNIGETIRNCLLLLGINTIYFMRAKMEERHLGQDETYRKYAAWIGENGIFNKLGKRIPFFKYRQDDRFYRDS